jgi:translocation and assembly module TamA
VALKTAAKCYPMKWLVLLCWGILSVFMPAGTSLGESGVPYEVTLEGVADKGLQGILKALSNTFAKQDEPPATLYLLKRRTSDDIELFRQALRSRGYYAAQIDVEIDEKSEPVQVRFHIQTGPPYLLKSVDIVQESGEPFPETVKVPSAAELNLEVGQPSNARRILDAQDLILRKMQAQGYPFAKIMERRVVVDHSVEGVLVTYRMELGPLAHFGATDIKGLESVEEGFIRRKLPWKQGDRFNGDLFVEARKRYTETRLFSLILIKHAEALDADGELPISIELKERKHRSVRAGVSYATDEGAGVTASWENRNLFHQGEKFKTALTISSLVLALDNTFQKADFMRPDQSLNANLRVARDDTDAFTSNNLETSLIVQRELMRGMKIGAGPGFRLSRVDQTTEDQQNFALLSFPGQFDWDTSDNLLDPTRGGRLRLQASPYYDMLGSNVTFFRTYASYSRYFALLEHPFLLFAGRGAVGSMGGTDRDSIPADIRFYAGGGGSIRGYPYQTVSPLLDGEPIGGRSLVELSAEFRLKVTKSIGLVAFLDGGSAFDSVYPDFSTSLRWGTGAGVRYFTPIGPLRVDVGVPLNRREGLDDPFQVYISLGQAF